MGNAFAAVADDASAVFFNPAGLDQVPGGRAEFTYHYPFSEIKDITYATGAVSYNMSGRGFALGTFAAGVNYFKASGIPEAGGPGLTGRTFSDYESAIRLAWGKGLGGQVVAGEEPRYNLGIGLKIVATKIYEYNDGGFGVDAGFMFRPLAPVRVGIAFDNLIAPNVDTAEGRVRKDGDLGFAAGGEGKIGGIVALRAGYRYPEEMPAAGLGVAAGKYSFDFCWRPHRELGDSYVATAGFGW
jgi:hypothetical protein